MTHYEISREDKGKVAELEYNPVTEHGELSYIRFDPPIRVRINSKLLFEALCKTFIEEQGATIREV